jgi:hypothetical protein
MILDLDESIDDEEDPTSGVLLLGSIILIFVAISLAYVLLP